jgi:hypothetical protein
MIRSLVVIAVLSFLMMGCGTVTRPQMIKAIENYTPPVTLETNSQNSLVYIVRPDGMGGIVSFEVSIDKTVLGRTMGGQYIYFYIVPGNYKLVSKAENTENLNIITEAGKTYFIKQTPTMGLLFARNMLSILDDVEGKYSLKQCKPGDIKQKNYPSDK